MFLPSRAYQSAQHECPLVIVARFDPAAGWRPGDHRRELFLRRPIAADRPPEQVRIGSGRAHHPFGHGQHRRPGLRRVEQPRAMVLSPQESIGRRHVRRLVTMSKAEALDRVLYVLALDEIRQCGQSRGRHAGRQRTPRNTALGWWGWNAERRLRSGWRRSRHVAHQDGQAATLGQVLVGLSQKALEAVQPDILGRLAQCVRRGPQVHVVAPVTKQTSRLSKPIDTRRIRDLCRKPAGQCQPARAATPARPPSADASNEHGRSSLRRVAS